MPPVIAMAGLLTITLLSLIAPQVARQASAAANADAPLWAWPPAAQSVPASAAETQTAQASEPPPPAPPGRRPAAAPGAAGGKDEAKAAKRGAAGGRPEDARQKNFDDCMATYDPATNMTRREWAATCRRISREYPEIAPAAK